MSYLEINFDGLVGPTHNYAGLSSGNVASTLHKGIRSNPRAAALQGLSKAKALADRGFAQAVLPPADRPLPAMLRHWGIPGDSDTEIIGNAAVAQPGLLAAASSASSMWTANACTMTPSCDSADSRAHFTPANLFSKLHRSIEAGFTTRLLRTIFSDSSHFTVHPPLAGGDAMSDEGAANHTRLCSYSGEMALHLFVYGRTALSQGLPAPVKYPARQTLESFQAIARRHLIPPARCLFVQQSPEAIDAGVFHNDVISVGDHNVFLYHESAFIDPAATIRQIQTAFTATTGEQLALIPVSTDQLSLGDAVQSYLFNSQLMRKPDGTHLLVVPGECHENQNVRRLLRDFVDDPQNPLSEVISFDLRQSMHNGGGPACLRNRITLNENERQRITGRIVLDDSLYEDLRHWIRKHYREALEPGDLADSQLLNECRYALDELCGILELPALYDFQR